MGKTKCKKCHEKSIEIKGYCKSCYIKWIKYNISNLQHVELARKMQISQYKRQIRKIKPKVQELEKELERLENADSQDHTKS